ncbi:MAG TPA: Arc family DNA-binding protein [Terriglobales bacterium]|nr:Arc family DNA-binding protein [Terriglobales bacterium]
MASITIKNLPPELHQKLKAMAKQGGRSLNQEILQQLRAAAVRHPTRAQILAELEEAARLRAEAARQGVWVTEEQINLDKRSGRP